MEPVNQQQRLMSPKGQRPLAVSGKYGKEGEQQ